MKRGNVITLSAIVAAVVVGQLLATEPPITVAVPAYDPQVNGRPMMTAQELANMNAAAEAVTDAAAAGPIPAPKLPTAPAIDISKLMQPYYGTEAGPEPGPEPLTFNGYECTSDCSGHQAGYRWAERNWITDPLDCMNHSRSFEQGCQSWVEEQAYAVGCTDEEIDDGTCEF